MKSTSAFTGLVNYRRGQLRAGMITDPTGSRRLNLNDGDRFRRRRGNRLTAGGEPEFKLFDEKEVFHGFVLFIALFVAMLKVKDFGLF